METAEILEALSQLTNSERLEIVDAALRLVHQEQHLTREQRRQQMKAAALLAIQDYASNSELTAFTVLDGEDFHDSDSTNAKEANA